MILKYALLCDHADVMRNGKPIAVGIFERFITTEKTEPLVLPPHFLLARLECSLIEGAEHRIGFRLLDADSGVVRDTDSAGTMNFTSTGPGFPLCANVVMQVVGQQVPGPGDYTLMILIDGNPVGEGAAFAVTGPIGG